MSCTGHPRATVSVRGLQRALSGALIAAIVVLSGCVTDRPVAPCRTTVCDAGMMCVLDAVGEAVCVHKPDACDDNPCGAGERCALGNDGAPVCLEENLCFRKDCPAGKKCDPGTGECSLDLAPCENVVCGTGKVCNPDTNLCEAVDAACQGVCCPTDFVCNPANGECEQDLCAFAQYACACGPSQFCEPLTGACRDRPSACGSCAADQYCDNGTGKCVTIDRGPPAAGRVGSACQRGEDCMLSGTNGLCLEDGGLFGEMPGGMCSSGCRNGACPAGAACVNVGITICLDLCLADSDCRADYSCQQITSGDPRRYCFPRAGGGASTCSGADCTAVGGGCTEDNDCASGSRCARGWPGGYCVKYDCSPRVDCQDGSCLCLGTGDCAGSTIGLGACSVSAQNCRSGYACYGTQAGSDVGYCYMRSCESDFDCRVAGDACSVGLCDTARGTCHNPCARDADCSGGRVCDTSSGRCHLTCRSALDPCGPDAFCDTDARRCTRKCRSHASCSSSQYCDFGSGRCTEKCSTREECGEGSFCDALGRCRPACSGDAGCGGHEYCDDEGACVPRCTVSGCSFGEFCEGASGRCRRDLTSVLVGNGCGRDLDCAPYNGTCLTDSAFAGGYCTAVGCSAAEPCGPGAACIEDGGDRLCLKRCTPGQSGTCRSGYLCSAWGDEHVCVPQP